MKNKPIVIVGITTWKGRQGTWRKNQMNEKSSLEIAIENGRELIKFFKDIPDGVEILIDYADSTAIRMMCIPSEIIYESIYRELPELFEE